MKKNIIGVLIITFLLTSCTHKVIAEFKITNNTEYNIDSLKIEPNINLTEKYISLEQGETSSYQADMTSIPKTDGGYQISFLINKQKETQVFGYYTNGYPLEKRTKIIIEKDTILIDQVFD